MDLIPDFLALQSEVAQRSEPHALESEVHGPRHWRDVARVGLWLNAQELNGDFGELVLAFALLHDTQRRNDNEDPGHGPRAAVLARDFGEAGLLNDTHRHFKVLVQAIASHTSSPAVEDLELGLCFDADRLTLWRCGMTPKARYLSRPAARDEYGRDYSAMLLGTADVPWNDIYRAAISGRVHTVCDICRVTATTAT